jgi:hypothetical protein
MSVAKNLIAGHILENQLFPYPQLRDRALQRSAVDDILNNPIKGFGVLTYAKRRLTQATWVGRDKILSSLPQLLREAAGIYEDEEMNIPAGFILDKGSYSWDVAS